MYISISTICFIIVIVTMTQSDLNFLTDMIGSIIKFFLYTLPKAILIDFPKNIITTLYKELTDIESYKKLYKDLTKFVKYATIGASLFIASGIIMTLATNIAKSQVVERWIMLNF